MENTIPAVQTSTTAAKTVLAISNIANAVLFCLYVVFLITLAFNGSSQYSAAERNDVIFGSVGLMIWGFIWFWFGYKGYKSINQLRKECFEAKLNQK